MGERISGEPVLMEQIAGRLAGGANLMGGTITLTPHRVVFTPLISRSGLRSSNRAARISQHLHDWSLHPQKLLNMAIAPLTKPIDIPLDRITDIAPTRRCAVRVSWSDDTTPRTMEFGISATWFSTIWNPENVARRDELVAALDEARKGRATG